MMTRVLLCFNGSSSKRPALGHGVTSCSATGNLGDKWNFLGLIFNFEAVVGRK